MRVKSKCKNKNMKKILSLHDLHSPHGLQSAWSAFRSDHGESMADCNYMEKLEILCGDVVKFIIIFPHRI